ncbi:MAG TPA: bifunctional lysylphosphatidylglycerol flippase/synthetase MprF [Thermodesulfobacteriota bacterium]|nr:bifunctional lysylphosphatidylglycerol flippase/synthetase MprF [Thermodesulfobacteriota bacterium]
MNKKLINYLGPLFGLALFTIALFVLRHALREYHYHDIVRHLQELSLFHVSFALVLTILDYAVLTGYDSLAMRYIQRPLAYARIALTSFLSYAFSHNIGLSVISGASVRYRLYSSWGFSAVEITNIVAFTSMAFLLGLLTLGGLIFLVTPLAIPLDLRLPFSSTQPLGMILLAVVLGYLAFSGTSKKRVFKIRGWEFPVPSLRLSLAQIAVSSLDWALAGSVLYALLPSTATLSFPHFLSIYLLAQIAGMVSQIPGGLGVFETVVILLLSPILPAPSVLVSLLAFRGIYYLLPLGVAMVLLGTYELFQKKEGIRKIVLALGQWIPGLAPHVFAFTTFLGGAILLFSGAMPAVGWRLTWLKDFIPLPILEISHFLNSLAGVGLLLLSRGIQRRLDAAYLLTVGLLSAGIIFSLLKGLDYEEALILSIMLATLVPARRYFYRKASLISQRFTLGWTASIVLILLGSLWLGFFSYQHIEYSHELWWRFALSGEASRSLRAAVGAIAAVLFFSLARLLRPAHAKPALPTLSDLNRVRPLVERSRRTSANLALLGDKALLFSETGNSFIMYGIEGRSWVALGDPIGPENEMSEIVWQFRELCDSYDGWTVFYQVGPDNLPLYLDLGLTLLKLGEEGRVPLDTFSLEGGSRKGFRHLLHKFEKEGCTFEITSQSTVPSLLPELKTISDAWLEKKNTREKGFSLGFFKEKYVQQFPVAVLKHRGRIVAFVNIWMGAEKEEISLDLMRYLPEAPEGVMDYIFIQLMLWGKREGYRWFNLGMAPLSGLENRPLSPLWSRVGAVVFRHGEHFYNFQGLRYYKEKFDPRWEPKYLASPGGLSLPRILTNIASLISGGMKGVFAK